MCRLILLCLLPLSSCAYKFGYIDQKLPLDIERVYIPPFENETLFVGPELDFTNQLIKEFKRSRVGELVSINQAQGVLQGRVISIQRIQKAQETQPRVGQLKNTGMVNLPRGTLYTTEYLLRVKVELQLKRPNSKKIIWKQWFTDETIYASARLALENINTATPNYTYSEEQRVIESLAGVMMQEAVGRLTEGF